jgi:Tol biopolymer transport system component
VSTILTGLSRIGIAALAGGALLLAATACSGGDSGEAKPVKPAERHLVYIGGEGVENANVMIAGPNGQNAHRLTSGFVALLSPDGKTVAVQRKGQGIFLVSSDGTKTRRLTAKPLRPVAWSPDGQTLYVSASSGPAVVELLALDRDDGSSHSLAKGSFYGFDISPDGSQLVYSRAPEATAEGICGDQFDLYVTKLDGSSVDRITNDGVSAFPAWGPGGIAFSHFPSTGSPYDCNSPGIWTIDPDGSNRKAVIASAPDSINLLGFYGLQPLGWIDDSQLLIGLRGESGTQGAVLDLGSKKIRRLGEAFADEISSDGRYSVGSGGVDALELSIMRISDGKRVFLRKNVCCPDWNR